MLSRERPSGILTWVPARNGTAPIILEEETDIIDELAKLADASSARVEIISDDFEEGSILFTAFGGIAAILRYRTGY